MYKTKQAVRVFAKLELVMSSSSHHIKGFLISPRGKKVLPALYVNKGSKDIPTRISRKLMAALMLEDEADFHTLMSCKMSRSDYYCKRFGRE
jgi:hypothetical protein